MTMPYICETIFRLVDVLVQFWRLGFISTCSYVFLQFNFRPHHKSSSLSNAATITMQTSEFAGTLVKIQ